MIFPAPELQTLSSI